VEKYCRAGEVTDDNMVYTHCMLYKYGYRHTHTHTHTHTEYVILIAFPRQHWMHERVSKLRYVYNAILLKYLSQQTSVSRVAEKY
jgi:hypothetical protein